MKTIVLSEQDYRYRYVGSKAQSCEWTNPGRPSIEGYELAVLDLPGSANAYPSSAQLVGDRWQGSARFWEFGSEVARLLESGGIVVAFLSPIQWTSNELCSSSKRESFRAAQMGRQGSLRHYDGPWESSYDWLDWGFVRSIGLDVLAPRSTRGISVVAPRPIRQDVTDYFRYADRYWMSLDSPTATGGAEVRSQSVDYHVLLPKRWGPSTAPRRSSAAVVLARGEQTGLPVASAVKYMDWDGVLILLPPPDWGAKLAAKASAKKLMASLEGLASAVAAYLEKDQPVHPEWAYARRPPTVRVLADEVEDLRRKGDLKAEALADKDKMLSLIDGTGNRLVDAVVSMFKSGNGQMQVEVSAPGASIDLFVRHKDGRDLAIEVTGVNGPLFKNDPHWSDFLDHLPNHVELNQQADGRIERMVLAVNTFRQTPLESRDRTDDITSPARKIARDNGFCVIRTCDLFDLWCEHVEGKRTIGSIFDQLFRCSGVYGEGE